LAFDAGVDNGQLTGLDRRGEGLILRDCGVLPGDISDLAHVFVTFNFGRHQGASSRGGFDIFATIGVKVGAKTGKFALSDSGHAKIDQTSTSALRTFRVNGVEPWGGSLEWAASRSGTSYTFNTGVGLGGETDSGSLIQPTFVCQYVIQAI
jgi:hypothetical protein